MPEIRGILDRQGYFVLHAPRQVGKTTSLSTLARELTDEGRFAAALVSMEVGAALPTDIGARRTHEGDGGGGGRDLHLPRDLAA